MTNETLKTVAVDCGVAVTDAQLWDRQGVQQKLKDEWTQEWGISPVPHVVKCSKFDTAWARSCRSDCLSSVTKIELLINTLHTYLINSFFPLPIFFFHDVGVNKIAVQCPLDRLEILGSPFSLLHRILVLSCPLASRRSSMCRSTQYSLVHGCQCFRGTCCLQLQCWFWVEINDK